MKRDYLPVIPFRVLAFLLYSDSSFVFRRDRGVVYVRTSPMAVRLFTRPKEIINALRWLRQNRMIADVDKMGNQRGVMKVTLIDPPSFSAFYELPYRGPGRPREATQEVI